MMSDKRFWQGALVGAAATLLLTNKKVRSTVAGVVAGTGNMVKNGSSAAREKAGSTADTVRETVAVGGEIFRDTCVAGKQGFQESVKKHRQSEIETGSDSVETVNAAVEEPSPSVE